MAVSSRSSTPTAKQLAAAERSAALTAEQRRLKEAAAERRRAAAARDEAPTRARFVPQAPRAAAEPRPSKYLQ